MSNAAQRILIVDDELGIREGCRKILVADGYEVEVCDNGRSGLELFKKRGNFSAVVVDLKMPQMNGIELTEKIHEHDQDAVILVITAYAAINTAVESTKRGAYGYIPKPFTPDELLLPVKNGLEKRALCIEARQLRQEREKRLLEVAFERSKCSTIIKCMTDGVLVINYEGQLVLRNDAAARIIPQCASLPLPSPLSALTCTDLQLFIMEIINSDSVPTIVSREIKIGKCTYMANIGPLVEFNEEIAGVVVILRDITTIKKLETAKSMFVSMVAHEVKSPLAAVEGYLNLILSGLLGNDAKAEMKMMERSLIRIQTLRSMVSELMNLKSMETGNFIIKRSPIDIRKVASEAVESCREEAEKKKTALYLNCGEAGEIKRVLADKDALLIVLTNLVDNAVKYTPDEGRVDVAIEMNGSYVEVKVKDNGIGMTPEEKEKVFDEFYRAKNISTTKVSGTGLGLSLVKKLLDMHHAKIRIKTDQGKGSEFVVSIPIVG